MRPLVVNLGAEREEVEHREPKASEMSQSFTSAS